MKTSLFKSEISTLKFEIVPSLVFLLLLFSSITASAQTTQPTTSSPIEQSFRGLADPDPSIRDKSRWELMGLSNAELPALRKVVEGAQPLQPAQIAVLRDIVTHIYLSGETYPSDVQVGFMGIKMDETLVTITQGEEGQLVSQEPGVVVTERFPGFGGFRSLLDGDVILAVGPNPAVRVRLGADLSAAVKAQAARNTIELVILRQGKIAAVKLELSPLPLAASDPVQMNQSLFARNQKAREYWDREFAPLLGERMS